MREGGYPQLKKTLNVAAFEDFLSTQQSTLPHLENVEQLSERVIRLLGQNPGKFTLQGTNTYIVGTGSPRLLIDTGQGIAEWVDLVSASLKTSSASLDGVLLTHWHGDHTGGVPDLIGLYPHLANAIYKNTPDRGQLSIADGQTFSVEGATLRAVHSPGHADDHMCFVLEEENAMFTGDNILGHGTSAVEDLSEYMDSLRKMQTYGCAKGYPAHGDVVTDLPKKIECELDQKVKREKQVLTVLQKQREEREAKGKGSLTVQELVTQLHGDHVDEGVREMVLEPFMGEVLKKLAEDGKAAFEVRRDGRKWFGVDD